MKSRPFWEETFQNYRAKSFGEISSEILCLVPLLPPNAEILDIGAGDGRNTLPLLRAGFNVLAVDISEPGINKIRYLAEQEKLKVKTIVADMTQFHFPKKYNLIIAHGCLHFLGKADRDSMIKKLQFHTKVDGFNAVTVFTDQVAPPPDLSHLCKGLFMEEELCAFYSNWEMQIKKRYIFQDEHPGGIKHTHSANKLVAKRLLREQ